MILLIIWLIGALIAVILPKEILKLAHKTLSLTYIDDGKPFFNKEESDDDFPNWMYIGFTFILSWLSVLAIYITTIIYILIHKNLSN